MSFLKLARNPRLANTTRNLLRYSRSDSLAQCRDILPLNRVKSSLFRCPKNRFLDKTVSIVSARYFTTKNTDGDDVPPEEEPYNPQLPATVAVPEVWPHVPVIAISKNIVFPRFIKLIEIANPQLIELIRRKVKLNQPYCGIFLKKNEENESELVNNLEDVYKVGVFAQIHELQDLGDRLRLVVMAHRRIKITGQIFDTANDEPKEEDTRGRRKNRASRIKKTHPDIKNIEEKQTHKITQETGELPKEAASAPGIEPLLMAEVENVVHNKFRQTEEVKALTQEVIKTIRDIISLNPLYR